MVHWNAASWLLEPPPLRATAAGGPPGHRRAASLPTSSSGPALAVRSIVLDACRLGERRGRAAHHSLRLRAGRGLAPATLRHEGMISYAGSVAGSGVPRPAPGPAQRLSPSAAANAEAALHIKRDQPDGVAASDFSAGGLLSCQRPHQSKKKKNQSVPHVVESGDYGCKHQGPKCNPDVINFHANFSIRGRATPSGAAARRAVYGQRLGCV